MWRGKGFISVRCTTHIALHQCTCMLHWKPRLIKGKGHNTYIAPCHILLLQRLCVSQTEQAYSPGRSLSSRPRTFTCSHTAIHSHGLSINGLRQGWKADQYWAVYPQRHRSRKVCQLKTDVITNTNKQIQTVCRWPYGLRYLFRMLQCAVQRQPINISFVCSV